MGNGNFFKEDIQMKRYPTSLASKRTQIKATVKYHFPLTRIAVIKTTDNNKCQQDCGETGSWWEYKMVQLLWKTVWQFLKRLHIELL